MQGGSECSAEVKGNVGMGEWENGRKGEGRRVRVRDYILVNSMLCIDMLGCSWRLNPTTGMHPPTKPVITLTHIRELCDFFIFF